VQSIPLNMIRHNLDGIPQYPFPAPYSFRWYQPGDGETWLQIHLEADRYSTLDSETFRNSFGTNDGILAERQFYVCDGGGQAVGTTTAWFDNDYNGRRFGRIHWVALEPTVQGRGLANAMLTLACNRLVELGHDRAYLDTATVRTKALNLYLKFGFVPELRRPACLAAWRSVRPHIRSRYWQRAAAAVPELTR
jgi:ribosomal protein S18 acetylase RimI-like enzyme